MAKVRRTDMLLAWMPCSRSVRGCAARSRREIDALVALPTTLS
jgi:hypothetical protein